MLGRRPLGFAVAIALLVLVIGAMLYGYSLIEIDRHGAKETRFAVDSTLVGKSLEQIVVAPRGGAAGRALLVLLHGRGSSPDDFLTQEWYDGLSKLGKRAPALLLVNGGESSYYHDRSGGRWGSYVLQEAIPAGVEELGADGGRIAIGGISMGGFGALRLGLKEPGRFCAVGGHSAAIWREGGETPAGAFDDAEDFEQNDVIEIASKRLRPFDDTKVWLDVGDNDPFLSADEELARILIESGQEPIFNVWPGDHSDSYWDQHVDEYMSFYARALAVC